MRIDGLQRPEASCDQVAVPPHSTLSTLLTKLSNSSAVPGPTDSPQIFSRKSAGTLPVREGASQASDAVALASRADGALEHGLDVAGSRVRSDRRLESANRTVVNLRLVRFGNSRHDERHDERPSM